MNKILLTLTAALLLFSVGCTKSGNNKAANAQKQTQEQAQGTASSVAFPVINSFGPVTTPAGVDFNLQPGGNSSIWFKVENTPSTVTVRWDDNNLAMTYSEKIISCLVPKENYSKPGEHKIFIIDTASGLVSNTVIFTVK